MYLFKRSVLLIFFVISSFAQAHPHSFIDLKNEVLVENKQLKGFKMAWTMDEIASAELIYEVNASKDKAKTRQQIADEMRQTAIENHYFSYLYDSKGELIKFTSKPTDTSFSIKDNRVTFYITFYLSQMRDLANQRVQFYTYEPSYYMAMEYNGDQDLKINSRDCKAELHQPKVNSQLKLYASSLDKNETPDMPSGEGLSLGAQFAQKVSVLCQ